jgi:hypothetical protein
MRIGLVDLQDLQARGVPVVSQASAVGICGLQPDRSTWPELPSQL